jgi:hypothetical protein
MANYFTAEKKAALKKKLRMAFRGRMVGELIDEIEAALTDFDTDEVVDQITAQIADGELIDAAIDTLIAAAVTEGGVVDNAIDTLVAAGIKAGVAYTVTPDAAANDAVLANTALSDGATQEITEGITDPDVPRPLVVVTTMAGGTLTGTVTITGTDVNDEALTEDVTLNNDDDVETANCFKTVTQVDLPAWTTSGDGIAIGTVAKIGFPVLLTKDTIYMALVDGAQDTLPTVTVDAADVEKVIIEPNTAPDGSKVFDFYYHA